MPPIDPTKAREFATNAVKQLRDAGFEALWAGGCVRDMLMKREPKDYDVATNARPEQIREVFGHRRTLAIGASFGVIAVIGPSDSGQIDVATFRRDAQYSDGRHPDSVTFCNAQEDAQRRDFTINGLFFDPIDGRVIDYVGGQVDLDNSVIRAIGEAAARFQEDKLRLLRAVRFASTLGFAIDPGTFQAVQEFAPHIRTVSAERITEEMRRILVSPMRRTGLELLRTSGLLTEILPDAQDIFRDSVVAADHSFWEITLQISAQLGAASFAAALAVLLRGIYLARGNDWSVIDDFGRDWRISNDERTTIQFCLQHEKMIRSAPQAHWPQLQRALIDPRFETALSYWEAVARVLDHTTAAIDFCRGRLAWPTEELNPKPLIDGNDLSAQGIPKGPIYKELLDAVREAQLLGDLHTHEQALAWTRSQWAARNHV